MDKIKNEYMFGWYFIVFLYVMVCSIIILWCISYDSSQLRSHLISVIPWFLEINFLLIIIGVCINIKYFIKSLEDVSTKEWYLVLFIVLLGTVMVLFVSPKVHRIFYDETIYLNIGQTMAAQQKSAMCAEGYNNYKKYHCAQLEHNKQPYAFPHLLSIIFKIFGVSETAGFLLNNAIFLFSIFIMFLLGYFLFKNFYAGFYSSLVYCLIPENIIWANTTAVEPAASLFTGLLLIVGLMYLRNKKIETIFLLSVLMSYSIQFRPESFMIVFVIFIFFLLFNKKILLDQKTYFFVAFMLLLTIPYFIQLYVIKDNSWGSSGTRMSFGYFVDNLEVNSLFYINNGKFPVLFTLLFLFGFLQKDFFKEKLLIFIWFILFWGIFLFFYAGSYEFGQDVRFSLVSYMPISLLAGLGIERLEKKFLDEGKKYYFRVCFISILIISFLKFMPHIRTIGEEACQARADHCYAQKMASLIKNDSIILTHNPNMFLLWGKNAAQAAIATNNEPLMDIFFNRHEDGVYFHYNYWCNVNNQREQSFCQNILNKYNTKNIVEYHEKGYKFVLYKLSQKQN